MRAGGHYVMGIYDNGGPNTDADRSFAQYIGTVANSSPDDRGLGSDKTFRTLIRCVATVDRELCATKRKKNRP